MEAPELTVAAAPTIDLILLHDETLVRPGGPGLYASAAARLLGSQTRLVGAPGQCTAATVMAEASLGARRLTPPTVSPGAVFVLMYWDRERSFLVASRPTPLDAPPAGETVLSSPVYGEAPLPVSQGLVIGVDAQGYVRAGLEGLLESRGAYQVLHYSRGELDSPPSVAGIVVETNGPGPITVYAGGREACRVPVRGPLLEDPTGAGDAFTAAYTILVARGLDPCGAAEEASRLVPEALGAAREAAESVAVPDCSVDCRVRVVMFDLDGTIIDTMEEYADAAARIISRYTGASVEDARRLYLSTKGRAFPDQLRLAGVRGRDAEEAYREFIDAKKRVLSGLRVPEAFLLLARRLREQGLRVAVSTNNECSLASRIEGLAEAVDMLLCFNGYTGKGAPHLAEVMAAYHVEPCQVLFVGDADYDVGLYSRLGVRVERTTGLWDPSEADRLLSAINAGG